MILNAAEKKALDAVIADLEAIASHMAMHSSTKDALYRNAAALRNVTKSATVTKSGRSDGHPC